MKPKHIFWGLLFVTTGILILLNNLGSLNIDLNDYWKFWPLVLIILGVSFLIGNVWIKSFLAGISGIILAVALFSLFTASFDFVGNRFVVNDNGINFDFDDSNYDTSYYSEPFSANIKEAEFEFEAGAGKFRMDDTTDQLFEANTRGYKNNYNLTTTSENGKSVVKFNMKEKKLVVNSRRNTNKVLLKLNTSPVWNMKFKVGAAALDFDLSPYIIQNVLIDMGAASMRLKLGDKSDVTNLNIDAGVSSISIDVPDSAGCEINADVSLSSKHFEDFQKVGGGLYKTSNFDSAKKKIYINVKTGISSITVHRYSGW